MGKVWRYVRAAFFAPANLFGLVAVGLGSGMTHDALPALIAAGVEGLYLVVTSAAPTFRRNVDLLEAHTRAPSGEVATLLETLAPSQREHYHALCELERKIEENYRKLPGGGVLAASSTQPVEALLNSFVRLVAALNHYRKYLNPTSRKEVEDELAEVEADLEEETQPKLREVKEKRAEILRKRVARFQQASESRELISNQLAGIEDLLQLTFEQSIAIRDPQSVTQQIDALSAEVTASEETVREMERFLEVAQPLGGIQQEERVR